MVLSMKRWEGKVAVVSGASSGVGAAVAEELVKNGLVVVGLARREDILKSLADKCKSYPGKFHPRRTDISNEKEIVDTFKWILSNVGPVSVLVNCAGLTQPTTLVAGDADMWRKVLDVNVLGLSITTREAIAHMQANKIDGHVVHINSTLGHYLPMLPNMNVYPASKFAVTALTETLRQELIQTKIRVTSISPGPIASNFASNLKSEMEAHFRTLPKLEPTDIVDAIMYALSTPPHVQVHDVMIRPIGDQA